MKAIVTGSFDPITTGHLEIIKKAASNYDKLYVVALVNETKEYMFSLEEKKELIQSSISSIPNAIADAYSGLTVDYMHKNGITIIIRGIRDEKDIPYENDLANKMQECDKNFKTIFIKCNDEYKHISSSLVREKIIRGEKITGLVHPSIEKTILKMYRDKKNQ